MAATPDMSAIINSFVEFGGQIINQKVLDWKKASDGILIRNNVTSGETLPKRTANGQPMPYRAQEDFTVSGTDNGVKYQERTITTYQSKWDFQLDLENFRNTELHKFLTDGGTEAQAINAFMAEKYLEYIIKTMGNGVRNASGTTAADIFNGFLNVIASEITALTVAPVTTGATTSTNAVAAFEKLIESCSTAMFEQGGILYCSYKEFFKFKNDYRTRYTFLFDPNKREFTMDSYNFTIKARSWMGTSSRLIATVADNLVFGTDSSKLAMYPTQNLNLIKNRILFPAGCQIADLEMLQVGDQV